MRGSLRFGVAPIACVLVALTVPAPVAIAQQGTAPSRDAVASRAREEAVRERAEKIPEMLALAGIGPGSQVADVGAGTGFLTVRLARLVGPTGRVYAEDIEPRALTVLRERVREEKLDNVEIIQGTADDPKLPRDALDAIVILKAYHEMTAPSSMLARIRDAMKPAGRLVMVEPTTRASGLNRTAQWNDDVLLAQLAEEDLRAAGFQVAELRDPFVTQLAGRTLLWLIVAHRAPAVLLAPLRTREGRRTPDGREVVPPAGGRDDITRPDLRITVEDARKHVDAGTALVVDLRSDAEYREGHLPGAVSILFDEFDARAAELMASGKPVILYCG